MALSLTKLTKGGNLRQFTLTKAYITSPKPIPCHLPLPLNLPPIALFFFHFLPKDSLPSIKGFLDLRFPTSKNKALLQAIVIFKLKLTSLLLDFLLIYKTR